MDISQIGGQHFYYYVSCKRQLWFYMQRIQMESGFETVELGRLVHEAYFNREKHQEILVDGMKIDFIDKKGTLHETKSSKYVKKEHEYQVLFYLYYLHVIREFPITEAKIHYPTIKKVVNLSLNEKAKVTIRRIVEDIIQIGEKEEMPPLHENKRLCEKCSFYELCYI